MTSTPYLEFAEEAYDRSADVSRGLQYILVPGKYSFDKEFVNSSFNKQHKIFSYNPLEGNFSPLDFTPVGAISKGAKGVKGVYRGSKLISLGFSGYGRKKVKGSAVTIFVAAGSKITQLARNTIVEASSKSFQQNEDPRQPSLGPIKKPKRAVKKTSGSKKCPPGYLRHQGKCVWWSELTLAQRNSAKQ